MTIDFGRPQEREAFVARNRAFMTQGLAVTQLLNQALACERALSAPSDRVIYSLGRIGAEEFWEIVTNAANGYGVAALKLLRPLFEKTVTMMYLIRNPDKVDDFIDYFWVNARKSLSHMRSAHQNPVQTAEELAEIENRYQAVRPRYVTALCKKCGTIRDRGSWSALSLTDMARDVGVGRSYLALAYIPTLQIHTTVQGLWNWMRPTESGDIEVGTRTQYDAADAAVAGAHACVSLILEEHVKHFGLGIDVGEIRRVFRQSWPGHADALAKDDAARDTS
jgi:hypothetical protein